MLPGVTPGRGPPPGRGAPGRGPPGPGAGRGAGRSTGCCEENGLLPTRGVRAAGLGALGTGPGRGPGVGPAGRGASPAGGADGADGAAAAGLTGAAGAGGACGAGAAGRGAPGLGPPVTGALAAGAAGAGDGAGPGRGPPGLGAADGADDPLPDDGAGLADLPAPKDSRRRRATGASTVDDADLTNSPCSLSRARTCLLVTPSSLANSCTRALPATTSPVWRHSGGGPRLGFSYDAWSSGLHGVLMFFATCSLARGDSDVPNSSKRSTTAVMSGEPAIRSARPKARRRTASRRHPGSGCSHAPRPGSLCAASTVTALVSFPGPCPPSTATTRSRSTANSRRRHPMQVRTGPPEGLSLLFCVRADVSRWITAESTVTTSSKRKSVRPDATTGAQP